MKKAMKEQDIIDEIKKYLYNFDSNSFYGDYIYKRKKYKASNLLFSLLISTKLNTQFNYFEKIDIDSYSKYLNNLLLQHHHDEEFKDRMVKLTKELLDITDQITKLNGITFSFHEILTDKVNMDDMKDDLKNNLNDDMRFALDYAANKEKELVDRFREAKSPIALLIDSKARGNAKQIGQEFLSIGYKVDNKSNILRKPIVNSFLQGIDDPDSYYVASIGARNAIIQGTNSVADSGYLNRKLSFGTVDIRLSDTKDCNTDKYLHVMVTEKNKNILLNGRYIVDDNNELIVINAKNINDYVNKEVKLRSPVTCKCKDGICKTCYGKLSLMNKGLGIGLLAATNLAEIATQKLLSTKHLLNASIVKDNKDIIDYIDIQHDNNVIIAKKPFKIETTKANELFFILDDNKRVLFEHNFKDLLIMDIPNNTEIPVIIFDDEFTFEFNTGDVVFKNVNRYVNSDMNRLMKVLNRIYEKTGFMKEINDYNEYFKYMLDMLLELGNLPTIHLEIVLSQMCKVLDKNHLLWRLYQDEPLEIVSIKKSNLSNSLFSNILFERVKESLTNLNNYLRTDIMPTKYEKLFNNSLSYVE